VVSGVFDDSLHMAAVFDLAQEGDHTYLVTEPMPATMWRMGAERPHGLALAGDAGPADLVQSLGLYQRESHLPVRQGVLGQVNLFLPPLPRNLLTSQR